MTLPRVLYLFTRAIPGPPWSAIRLLLDDPTHRANSKVLVLEPPHPTLTDAANELGIEVESLQWKRLLQLDRPMRFRRKLREWRPEVIHAFGLHALRLIAICEPAYVASTVVSHLEHPSRSGFLPASFDTNLLNRCRRVLVSGEWEQSRWLHRGVRQDQIKIVQPGIGTATNRQNSIRARLGLADDAFVILCIGPLEREKGIRDAIWTLDILHYLIPEIALVIVGDGAGRSRLEAFTRSIGTQAKIHFVGYQPFVEPYIDACDLLWAPSLSDRGGQVVLEAQARGKPVIAARQECMLDHVSDGITGWLVPSGDKPAWARATRWVYENKPEAHAIGRKAQESVLTRFNDADYRKRFFAEYGASLPAHDCAQ